MTDPLAQKVVEIIAAQARRPADTLSEGDALAALGLDSLNIVEMVFAIEEAFDIQVPFNVQRDPSEAGEGMATVGSLVQAVRGLVDARQG